MEVLSGKYGELISPLFRYINVSQSNMEAMIPGTFPTAAPSIPSHRVNRQYKHYYASNKIINSGMRSSPSYLLVYVHSNICSHCWDRCCSNTQKTTNGKRHSTTNQAASCQCSPAALLLTFHQDPSTRTVTRFPGSQRDAFAPCCVTLL